MTRPGWIVAQPASVPNRKLRPQLVLAHRYVGLAMAGFLTIAGLTGSVLAFQSEIDAWLNPSLFHVDGRGHPLRVAQLVERVETAMPGAQVQGVGLPAASGDSALLAVSATGTTSLAVNELFADPASGRLLGGRQWGAFHADRVHLVPFLYRLHYSLSMPGNWGIWIMGGAALAWLLDCFVGFCLTLPLGRPFWKKWRPAWRVKRGAGAYRLNLDLHRALGLWLWPVLFMQALSGMSLNLRHELFLPALTAFLPTSPKIGDRPAPAIPPAIRLDWDAALGTARAEAGRRGWDVPVADIYLARETGLYSADFRRPHQAGFGLSTIYVSATDGHVAAVERAGNGKAGDVVVDLMLPMHTGQIAGLPGRILICITGLVVAILSLTGVSIWWVKRAPRLARKRRWRSAVAPTGVPHAVE